MAGDQPVSFFNRELSWLSFARRVLSLVEDSRVPLLERVKFAGITGMLHDEFFMKRISGLKRQIGKGSKKLSVDGLSPAEEFEACRKLLREQDEILATALEDSILPGLEREGLPILPYDQVHAQQRKELRKYFHKSVQPILTPLAVDTEHPFPFISNMSFNLAVTLPAPGGEPDRFVRIKIPDNRPRWVPLPSGAGVVPLEEVIAANLDLVFPGTPPKGVSLFRVVRGASGDTAQKGAYVDPDQREPGRIVDVVSSELKARRFAGVVRVQVDPEMPKGLLKWLTKQLGADKVDVYRSRYFFGVSDLLRLDVPDRPDLRYAKHVPQTNARLRDLDHRPQSIFEEIAQGDVLLHHPYQSFEASVLKFLESAAADPAVLAIKLTVYRTGAESPILRALAEAARAGKQVAVLVEITARFDEAPNIAWGRFLEKEGVHVAYGVEKLKTHVKLALVVREEGQEVRRYAHIGTGNYNIGTAKVYEDLGLLTCNPEICNDVATVFNSLTGAHPNLHYRQMLVAPHNMRARFMELIRREAKHAAEGRPSGIFGKMNQLQDPEIIRELYTASQAGVPIRLNIRGLCCLRPGVKGMSDNIAVYGLVGRFLEHSRIYRFANGGDAEYFIGSADWMKRNLDSRVETIVPILDPGIREQIDRVIGVYDLDNCSVWDCSPDGDYTLRSPGEGEPRREAQEILAGVSDAPSMGDSSPADTVSSEP